VLDRLYVDQTTQKIQPRPISLRRQKRRGRIVKGFYPPALRAVTGARGFATGVFPTLAIAALSFGSHRDSIRAATIVLKVEDNALLADVLAGRKPLLATAQSILHAANLIDSFRRASGTERQIFVRVITPGALFDVVTGAP
jgi:hypothetical protein